MSKRFHLFMAVAVFFVSLSSLNAAVAGWTVSDLTGTLELASVEENSPMWTVTIRNKSNAVITAASVAFRADAQYYQDWLNADPSGLAPGQTFDVTISAEDGSTHNVKLSAVIFDDGSGKGDPVQLEIMNCHRFGQILESARIREILRNRDASGNDSSIDTLARKVGTRPLSADDAFLSLSAVSVPGIELSSLKRSGEKSRNAVLWGVSTTRERALRQLDRVRQLPVLSADEKRPSRAELFDLLQEQYDKQNRKALSLLAKMQGGR